MDKNETLAEAAFSLGLDSATIARIVAREELASFCGLLSKRLQALDGDAAVADLLDLLKGFAGEALADFSGVTKGEAPGEDR